MSCRPDSAQRFRCALRGLDAEMDHDTRLLGGWGEGTVVATMRGEGRRVMHAGTAGRWVRSGMGRIRIKCRISAGS